MSRDVVVAVLPVFNPPAELEQRLRVLAPQVDHIVVVDDGSDPPVQTSRGSLLTLSDNVGIAAALNAGIAQARELGATAVMTVDQDSDLPESYVRDVLACRDRARAQGLHPAVVGAAGFGGLRHRGRWHDGVMVVPESIQSGALFDISALEQVGGFDESLVIDAVDTDVCLRLADAGWDVCVAPVEIGHALGDGHFVSVLGRRIWSSGHPAFRRYYITRNGLVVLRRHGRHHVKWAVVYARRLAVASVLAAGDPDQRHAMARAARDAWSSRLGKRMTHRAQA